MFYARQGKQYGNLIYIILYGALARTVRGRESYTDEKLRFLAKVTCALHRKNSRLLHYRNPPLSTCSTLTFTSGNGFGVKFITIDSRRKEKKSYGRLGNWII
jgi:hypothetical protein